MKQEIDPIPLPVPPKIIEAFNNEKLVVFLGAGVSRLAGSMSWKDLAANLVERCYTTKHSSGNGCITFREKETLLCETDHKKTITICHYILEENGYRDEFFEEFDAALKGEKPPLKSAKIYEELARLNAIFITTNADTHFDRYFRADRIFQNINDFEPSQIEPQQLYHIHGVKGQRESLVFRVDQYIERYKDPKFKKFMEYLFGGEYVILFMGYGLAEFEILDFLISHQIVQFLKLCESVHFCFKCLSHMALISLSNFLGGFFSHLIGFVHKRF